MTFLWLEITLDKIFMIIKSKWLNYKKISPNFFEENSRKFKRMNMNTRTPNNTYMKVQVRTMNLNRKKKTTISIDKNSRQSRKIWTTRN